MLKSVLEGLNEWVWLRSDTACEINLVKACCLAVEGHVTASLMGHATESPEEIEVPISTVKFAIGDYFISSLFLSLYESSDVLVTVFS